MAISPAFLQPVTPVTGKRFGIRLGAYIIDALVYFVSGIAITFVVAVAIAIALALAGRQVHVQQDQLAQTVNFIAGLILFGLYFAIFEALYGATLGKLILG